MKFDLTAVFHKTEAPDDNVVEDVGAIGGKLLSLDTLYERLVTEDVRSCIAVIAVDKESGVAGMWHLYDRDPKSEIERDLMPTLRLFFSPDDTELYLIGGKPERSKRLAANLEDILTSEGHSITDTALFGPHALDVAVSLAGEIHVRKNGTDQCLMHKPASETKLVHYVDEHPAETPVGILHFSRKGAELSPFALEA